MIIREPIIETNLIKTYSDEGYYILQVETGIEYQEAIDVENAPYTYIETSHKIGEEEEDEENPEETANTNTTL